MYKIKVTQLHFISGHLIILKTLQTENNFHNFVVTFSAVCKLGQVICDLAVPYSKNGIVPRSSLLGAGQLGFWEVGKGGTIG
jgi:hypothetical protein